MRPPGSESSRLFFLGFLTLFLELVLIRYLAGNIWNLGFFPNLVLLGVFLGMGSGFVLHRLASARVSVLLYVGAYVIVALLAAFVTFLHPAVPGFDPISGQVAGELFFSNSPAGSMNANWWPFVLWFSAVVLIFVLIAQRTAKLFSLFPPLKAYTLDILGSCCGILCFMGLSWLEWPAWAWFLVLAPLSALTLEPRPRLLLVLPAALLVAAGALAWQGDRHLLFKPEYSGELKVRWSPYQKVEYAAPILYVNGIGHQTFYEKEEVQKLFYGIPYRERARNGTGPARRVLILGAGSGNDVVAALANGVGSVDAVEIDPVIASMGRELSPARPYADSRVNLIVDDGRAVLKRATGKYDLIVFALTDSLVKVSPMAQLRLENYLFTEQSVRQAYSLLDDGGDLVFYNYYRRPWLIDKIERMISRATGKLPLRVLPGTSFSLMMVNRARGESSPPEDIRLGSEGDVPTDDWPFLYLQGRGIPGFYLDVMVGLSGLVLLLMLLLQWKGPRSGLLSTKLAFVLMGMAFLLLETKSVVQFALLFGTTWYNNSLVFLAILLLVLAANWTASALKGGGVFWVAYVLLLGSCGLTLLLPLGKLLAINSTLLRFVAASLLTFSPIYFANLLFSITFRDQEVAEHLFGWNLLGATLGGVLEYSSMVLGYNKLALLVALCYTAAFFLLRPRLVRA